LSAGALSVAAVLFAQGDTPPTLKLRVQTPAVLVNTPIKALLTVTFATGLHGYQNPPSDPTNIPLTVSLGDKTFSIVSVGYPKGTPMKVAGESKPINVYQGTISIPVTLKGPMKAGTFPVKFAVRYQQCNAMSCFQPSTLNATGSVIIADKRGHKVPKLGLAHMGR